MAFALGQHVLIRRDRKCFGGVTGVIADPPEWLADDGGASDPARPATRSEKRRNGMVIVHWVEFDLPTEDVNEAGSYLAAAVETEALEPFGEQLAPGVEGGQSMQRVF